MHPAISNELATARNADLRQAQGDTVGRAAAHLPSTPPQPGRNWIPVSLRRVGRQRALVRNCGRCCTHRTCSTVRPPTRTTATCTPRPPA